MHVWGGIIPSPQAVEDVAVGEHPQHDVVGGGVVDERPLGVDEEHIRHPDLLHEAPVEGHALVGGAREGQPLVLPVVPQIQSHGEVLREQRGRGVGVIEIETASGLSLTRRPPLGCCRWFIECCWDYTALAHACWIIWIVYDPAYAANRSAEHMFTEQSPEPALVLDYPLLPVSFPLLLCRVVLRLHGSPSPQEIILYPILLLVLHKTRSVWNNGCSNTLHSWHQP